MAFAGCDCDSGGHKLIEVEWYKWQFLKLLSLKSLVGPWVLPFLSGGFQLFLSFCEQTKIPFNKFSFCLTCLETVSDACNQKNITNRGSGLGLAWKEIDDIYITRK